VREGLDYTNLRQKTRNTFSSHTRDLLCRTVVAYRGRRHDFAIGAQPVRKAELIASWLLEKQANAASPVRYGVETYLHAAGIQAGYTFFCA
jgi:hypothetical protein